MTRIPVHGEVGIERVPDVFLRGARITYVGSFVGLFVFVGLGVISLRASVISSGAVSNDEAKQKYRDGWKSPRPYLRIVPQPK